MDDKLFQLTFSRLSSADRKIFHIGDRSYTEDKILIYTIYVTNAWNNEDKIIKYFSQYGKINDIYIVESNNNINDDFKTNAIIQYSQAESAAKALRDNNTLSIHNIVVTSVESDKQPYQQHFESYELVEYNQNHYDSLLLQLNFDCIYLIFTYLPLKDQIKMSLISNDFKESFRNYYKKRTMTINDNRIVFMEMRQIIFEFGENFERIDLIKLAGGRFFTLVLKFCPNIKQLRIEELELLYSNLGKDIAANMKSLEILKIINCSLKNNDLESLSNVAENIINLDLTGNRQITGDFLDKFLNLKILKLRGCHKIDKNIFHQINKNKIQLEFLELDVVTIKCKNTDGDMAFNIGQMNTLKCLHIYDSIGYNRNGFEEIFLFLKQLTDTQIVSELIDIKIPFLANSRIDIIFKYVNLEILDIQRFDSNSCTPKFWRNLAMLKELKCFNAKINDSLNETELLTFIKNSKNLEYVKVLGGPSAFYMEFLLRVLNVLNKKTKLKKLTIWRKSICKMELKKIYQHPEFIKNELLIKLKFDCMY